jgi:hypothetical protein
MGGDDGRVSARVPRETIETDYETVRSKILTTRGAEIAVDYRVRRSAAGWSAFDGCWRT